MSKQLVRRILVTSMVFVLMVGQVYASGPANGDIAYDHIQTLSQDIGNRLEGTDGCAEAADFIENEFDQLGYQAVEQPFRYTTKRDGKTTNINSENIIAVKKGLSDKQIIVGAHYDTVGVGTGADDNGSAIAVMLELAEQLKDVDTPYTIRFIAFGGEEDNLKGSKYYAGQMRQSEVRNTMNMIVLDSLIAGNTKYVYGDYGSAGVLRDLALKISQKEGLGIVTQLGTKKYPCGTTGPFSDHVPFKDLGIPYTYFEATDWTLGAHDGYTQVDLQYGVAGEIWHTEYDNLSYIENIFPGRVSDHLNSFVTVLLEVLTTYQN